ncbi:MAG: tRNA uridine-5-carboxymethylaminomethyl(34) synthesis enzyme MnmG [Simkania negevensis]|nr:tRNA uridine-5-carboxymethylaminomethyl(34) synthesis enzyme MnmG [Simkania negevensis]
MWKYPKKFDVIVIGAGHAGCEAAYIAATMGADTLLVTMNLDTIGKLSCNPAIGGTAKGHIVREIDALGGVMGKIADRTGIQFRMLNASKGAAVWSPRAQVDKHAYQNEMKSFLEEIPHLFLKQGTTIAIKQEKGKVSGVSTEDGIFYEGHAVILCAGTFMRGLLHVGMTHYAGGRAGDKPSNQLSNSLESLGFTLARLKTGTPPRVHRRSIDFSKCEEQISDEGVFFSFQSQDRKLPKASCYITYTNEKTKEIVLSNLSRSPLYAGKIQGVGPRYCPSIEDKVVRFKDKERHQIFLEPEGIHTKEYYLNGVSTSLPIDVQYEMIRTIAGLEQAEIMRPAYAIEYDYVISGQVLPTLETKKIEGLYFAGQINGTTGYEEAGAQGLMAAINAVLKMREKPPFILKRWEAYIGVLIDDLTSKELDEPYRMFTSRSEHRLLLRQDNADLRLCPYGIELGLIGKKEEEAHNEKKRKMTEGISMLKNTHVHLDGKSSSLAQRLCRPEVTYSSLLKEFPGKLYSYGAEVHSAIELDLKYAGYIERERREAKKLEHLENIIIPSKFDFAKVVGLSKEAIEKLRRFGPENKGRASRLSGVTPADISLLMVTLKKSG